MRKLFGRLLLTVMTIILIGSLCAGCAKPGTPKSAPDTGAVTAYPLQLTDDAGRAVTITAQPERIVSFAPGHTETLFALGLGDKVVGVDAFSDYPAAAQAVEKIGDTVSPNFEKIISLAPDVVFTVGTAESELVTRLAESGLPVVVLQATSVEDILADILTIGRINDAYPAAQTLVDGLRGELNTITGRSAARPASERATVFYEVSPPGQWGMWTAGPGSFIDDMIKLAGGINIAADAEAAYTAYSEEVLLDKNPAVIITPNPETMTEIGQRPGWEALAAVQNGRVYLVDRDTASRPGPRIIDALREIANAIYPPAAE